VQVAKAGRAETAWRTEGIARNNGINAAKALTTAMETVDSRGVGGKDSNKASNGNSSNGDC
jgi:hypothetical protein